MNDGTQSYVRELAIGTGALGQCPHCGEHHIPTDQNDLIEDCVAKVEASQLEGDLRLLGMADARAYVRAIIESSPTICEMRARH